jgi:hypothetical protein
LVGIIANAALASEVFHWVDEDGVLHFSQWAPQDTQGVSTLRTVSGNPPDYDPSDDPYSIRNQALRMKAAWTKTEERRAERRKAREEAQERAARRQPTYYEPPRYPYRYYPPYVRPPIHYPIYPSHNYRYVKKVQHHQIAGLNKFNRAPGSRVPYSRVTGVSQRATIQRPPGIPRRGL